MEFTGIQYVVVGAGFFGSVIAERIASDMNETVVIIEKRSHVGGNSYSQVDPETGIEVHVYGSHIFHTSDREVWDYITNFSEFNHYHHQVLASYKGRLYQMPINLNTINSFYNKTMKPAEAREFIERVAARERISSPKNFEEKALSFMGRPLYEVFIKGYTQKQWGIDPRFLPYSTIDRIPIRFDYESAYFLNQYQGIPLSGYGNLFQKMLSNDKIKVFLNTDFFSIRHLIPDNCIIIFTGPIDSYFDYKYGMLGWRTLTFEKEIYRIKDLQGTAVVNYVESRIPFTRIHEFRHYHPERSYATDKTVIFKEFSFSPAQYAQPYYPMNTDKDNSLLERYQKEAKKCQNVIFGGRLGSYKYLNMDETIRMALDVYKDCIKR